MLRSRPRSAGAFLLVAAAVGCGSADDDSVAPPADLLTPPPAGRGIQLRMVSAIDAGKEVEQCQFFRAPPEGLNLNHDEIRFTAGSHHVLLYLTPYEDIPKADELGGAVDPARPFDCSDGALARSKVTSLIAGSQNGNGDSIVDFPGDVAMKIPPNAVLLMNVHYVNARNEQLYPEVRLNVYTIPDAEMKTEGGLFFWYDPFIHVDAHGAGRATMSCPVPTGVTLGNAQSHMHRRGVDYAATLIDPSGGREVIYENTHWEGVPVEHWPAGLPVAAGGRIEYFCGYQNSEDRVVWQGPRTTDEMCMFIASYWPARADVSLCASDPESPLTTQDLAAEWPGNGAKSCADTLACVQGLPQDDEFMHGLTRCVLDARPESSTRVSDAIRCLSTSMAPDTECQSEMQACMAE